jgi:predicted phage tail protein
MDECPHCGEPLEENAVSCPHCGSDFETGWNPDSDYLSLELPDDEPIVPGDYPQASANLGWQGVVAASLVVVSFVVFVGAGALLYRTAVVPFAIVLGVSVILFFRWLSPRKKSQL